jgi:hypothetical protein
MMSKKRGEFRAQVLVLLVLQPTTTTTTAKSVYVCVWMGGWVGWGGSVQDVLLHAQLAFPRLTIAERNRHVDDFRGTTAHHQLEADLETNGVNFILLLFGGGGGVDESQRESESERYREGGGGVIEDK